MLSIRSQILAAIVAISGTAVLGYLFLATELFERDRTSYVFDLTSAIARTKAEEISAHLRSRSNMLRFLAAVSVRDRTAFSEGARAMLGASDEVLAIDLWEVRHGDAALVSRHNNVSVYRAMSITENDIREILEEGVPAFRVSDENVVAVFNNSIPPDIPLLSMAVPNRKAKAVVVMHYYPSHLLDMVGPSSSYAAAVVDVQGSVILHSDRELMFSKVIENGRDLLDLVASGSPRGVKAIELGGDSVLAAYAKVGVAGQTVVVTVPTKVAFAAIAGLRQRSIWFGIIVIFSTLLVAILIARRLTTPLGRLREAAQSIAEGRLSVNLPNRGGSEIRQVARSFNEMSVQLSERDAKLKDAYLQLQQQDRMALVGVLSTGVAHEIKNPLTYVKWNLQFVLEWFESVYGGTEEGGVADIAAALRDMREGTERIDVVVRDLKMFARPEGGEGEGKEERADLNEIMASSAKMATHELKNRAKLVADLGIAPLAAAHGARVGQVFLNLIINAAHAIPRGDSENNRVTVRTGTDAGGRPFASVEDTGEGIPENFRKSIFDPFFTTKERGVGTGLGLPICQRIVEEFGGILRFESEVGVGTKFTVTLPAAQSQVTSIRHDVGVPQSAPGTARILVIDAEKAIGSAVQRVIGSQYEVITMSDGRDALNLLSSDQQFDLILCDLEIPSLSGMEIFGRVRECHAELAERFVFVSGGNGGPEEEAFLAQNHAPLLSKPFTHAGLSRMLRRAALL